MGERDDKQLRLLANTLRMLAADAVEKANSGHPGLPMGAADCAAVLFQEFLRFHPADPEWPGRDRFVLSAGHGSMLLYGLLHLYGYDLGLDDLKSFRQWGSRTPGHPEHGHTPGVEVTTGPLGQGFAMGVGLALGAAMAAARFNCEGFRPVEPAIYGIVSDGDLMEGISHEAASLAGHLRLGSLVYLYDDNRITIDGSTDLASSDNVSQRFASYGWQVQSVDGHDHGQIRSALAAARDERTRPSLVIARTRIGWGSPGRQGTSAAHGAPLGTEELAATRRNLSWPAEPFHVPAEVRELCQKRLAELQQGYEGWQRGFEGWRAGYKDRARLWDQMAGREVPGAIADELLAALPSGAAATRTLGGQAIQRIAQLMPSLVSGSADLAHSTNTDIKDGGSVAAGSFAGRNIHYGIRELAMAAVMNGLARSGFFLPVGSTFLVFSDYCRPAIRLSALMRQHVIYVFTHDSIFVGEDGPTHQPVEQLSALRLIPGLQVIRPADATETAMAWTATLRKKDGPTALVLTRQKLPAIARPPDFDPAVILRGGYVACEYGLNPTVTIMASGSELAVAIEVGKLLQQGGIYSTIVSVPCLETFLTQDQPYRDSVVDSDTKRVAIEAGRGSPWHQLTGDGGLVISVETFGASAPDAVLAEKYGLTATRVAERIQQWLRGPA